MKAEEFYRPIYKSLENVTPIKKDCGILCGGICCEDGEEKTGMLLFPFEEKIISGKGYEIEKSNCEYGDDKTAPILFCSGYCDRKFRPLSCRIFPLTPYLKKGKLKLIMNPAARGMCPLARSLEPEQLEPLFVKNVYKAMKRIMKLKDGEDYINMLTEISDSYFNIM